MVQTDLQKAWELRINDFRTSGLTQTKWCEVSNVKIFQFKYWLKKIEKKQNLHLNGFQLQWRALLTNQMTFYILKLGKLY